MVAKRDSTLAARSRPSTRATARPGASSNQSAGGKPIALAIALDIASIFSYPGFSMRPFRKFVT